MKAEALHAHLRAHGLGLPEAWEDFPWGDQVLKVRKKIFAFIGQGEGGSFSYTVKLPLSGEALLSRGRAKPTGYGLGKAGWVSLRWEPGEEVDDAELVRWMEESYRAVAPKKLARQVDF